MSTKEQVSANRANSKHSTGPSAKSWPVTRLNGLKHGLRASTVILPGEDPQEFENQRGYWVDHLKPRNRLELEMVVRCVCASWMLDRVENAIREELAAQIEEASDKEEEDIFMLQKRLFWDARGPHSMYGLSSRACGGPRTSFPGEVIDPNEPWLMVKRLESTAKGCQALIDHWRTLGERVERGLGWQSHDRFRAIRMLGKQPADVANDPQISLIFVASHGIRPDLSKGPHKAYNDLQCDLGTLEHKKFVDRVRTRWGLILNAQDTALSLKTLRDLVASNVERLEAKRQTHLAHAAGIAARRATRLSFDRTPDGQRMRRYQMDCQRRLNKCQDAYWKHRREADRMEQGGGGTYDGGRGPEGGGGAHWEENAVDPGPESVVIDGPSEREEKAPSEANLAPAATEVKADQVVEAKTDTLERTVEEGIPARLAGIRAGIKAWKLTDALNRPVQRPFEKDFFSSGPPPWPTS